MTRPSGDGFAHVLNMGGTMDSAEAKAKGFPLKEALKLFMLDVAKLEQCTGHLATSSLRARYELYYLATSSY
eukprot:SAG31_NODE_5188_length_2691_cov_1.557099_1_plen_72_part_00